MKNFYPVIEAHVQYVLAMRVVFEKIFRILLPRRKSTADFFGCKEQFLTILDEEFAKIDLSTATVEDYRLALEDVCLNDVEQAIEFLFSLCKDVGFERYANRYLNKFQFAKMMCDSDKEKLAKLETIVDSGDTNLGRVFMRIGGVLDGRENAYEDLDESAKAKAAYAYYKPKLEPLGIYNEKDFRRELHKIYSRNSKRKAKELEAKRMGKAKPTSYTKISPANQAKYGTIEAMKTTKHSASITTQDFGGVKSCTEAAQNAAVRASCIPPPAISKAA